MPWGILALVPTGDDIGLVDFQYVIMRGPRLPLAILRKLRNPCPSIFLIFGERRNSVLVRFSVIVGVQCRNRQIPKPAEHGGRGS